MLALWCVPLAAAEPISVDNPEVDHYFSNVLLSLHKRKLESGLDVVLDVDRAAPVVALSVTFPSGANGGDAIPAVVDYLRHHRTFPDRADYDLLRARGAIEHRDSGWDHASYTLVLPPSELRLGLWLEAQRFRAIAELPPRLEQEAALEQRALTLLEPADSARLELERSIWRDSFHPIDLVPSTLNERYFNPQVAVLTISGDFDSDEAARLLGQYLGPTGGAPPESVTEPAADTRTAHTTSGAGLLLGWLGPAAHEPEFAAFQVLAHLLTSPESDWYKRLRAAARASALGGGISEARGRSLLALELGLDVAPGELTQQALLRTLRELSKRPPSGRAVSNAQKALLLAWLRRFASAESRAELFGRYETLSGDARLATRHHQLLARVTPEAVQRVLAERMVARAPFTLAPPRTRSSR